MSFANHQTDSVTREPSSYRRVSAVHPNMPNIKSYAEAGADYHVIKPTSSFELAPTDEFVRWRTTWGTNPSSCSLTKTMGRLSKLYGFDQNVTWSPNCYNLQCAEPGHAPGPMAASFQPQRGIFSGQRENTANCFTECYAQCPSVDSECVSACANSCLYPGMK